MYERAFGKLISSIVIEESQEEQRPPHATEVALEDATDSIVHATLGRTNKTNRPHHAAGNGKGGSTTNKGGGSGSEGETGEDTRKGKSHHRKPPMADTDDLGSVGNHAIDAAASTAKKSVQFEGNSGGGSNEGSDDSSPLDDSYAGMSRKDRVSAREARSRRRQAKIDEDAIPPGTEIVGGKRHGGLELDGHHPISNCKKLKHNETDDGEVVKVKLLTGTLYLYRGAQRRAEFVRRV